MRLQGKVAIVTGAASGFGAEIARQYVKEGAKVALADINEAGAKDVAGPLGPQALAVKCDVTQRADIDALVAATLKAFGGRLDIVVNNIRPRPGLTWYNSSKGAVNLMSKSLAVELGGDNIRVNAICPVMGATGLLEQFMGMPDSPENRKKFIATIPMGRLSTPLDIARAAVYLASDDAEFITGVEFPVDGGRTV
jgi:3-oxoacyl-[acyl-carrier protein] reductase